MVGGEELTEDEAARLKTAMEQELEGSAGTAHVERNDDDEEEDEDDQPPSGMELQEVSLDVAAPAAR